MYIMDADDTFEIGRMGVDGFVPASRAFASTITVPDMGAGYIVGGLTANVTA